MKKLYKVFSIFFLFISSMTLFCLFVFKDKSIPPLTVQIFPKIESGEIVLRGAMVDEQWINCSDLIISNSSWILNENNGTYKAIDDQPIELLIPQGKKQVLVFDAGPNCGKVTVNIPGNNTQLEFNMYQDIDNPWGNQYVIDNLKTVEKGLSFTRNQVAALALLSITIIFLSISIILKKDSKENKLHSKRNASVEFLRFAAIMCVVLHHYNVNLCKGGYLAVDFFSILTGFFLMLHFTKHYTSNNDSIVSAVQYMKLRYVRLIYPYLIIFLCSIIIRILLGNSISIKTILSENLWELLMLDGLGLTVNLVIPPGWYIQSMMLASYLCYLILSYNKKVYIYVIAPIVILLVFSAIEAKNGSLNYWMKPKEIVPYGTLRVFAEMGLGCVCYELYSSIKQKVYEVTTYKRFIFTVIESLCILYILYVVFYNSSSVADFISVIFMSVLIISLYMECSFFSIILNNQFSIYLGKISIAIYLSHIMIRDINWVSLTGLSRLQGSLIYFIVVIIFSSSLTAFVDSIEKNLRGNKNV